MRLFSKQGLVVTDLTRHVPDSSKSGYKTRITEHYPRLYAMLGTDRFIWCQTERPDWWEVDDSRSYSNWWELEIPREGVVRFVDTIFWNYIIGGRGVPDSL